MGSQIDIKAPSKPSSESPFISPSKQSTDMLKNVLSSPANLQTEDETKDEHKDKGISIDIEPNAKPTELEMFGWMHSKVRGLLVEMSRRLKDYDVTVPRSVHVQLRYK